MDIITYQYAMSVKIMLSVPKIIMCCLLKYLSNHEEFLGPAVSTNLPVGSSFLYENSNISENLLSEEDFCYP